MCLTQGSSHSGPMLTPAEALIAIHGIDPDRDRIPLKKAQFSPIFPLIVLYISFLGWWKYFLSRWRMLVMLALTSDKSLLSKFLPKCWTNWYGWLKIMPNLSLLSPLMACNLNCKNQIIFTMQVEQIPLPLLFMRTVLQAIVAFPSLVRWWHFSFTCLSLIDTQYFWLLRWWSTCICINYQWIRGKGHLWVKALCSSLCNRAHLPMLHFTMTCPIKFLCCICATSPVSSQINGKTLL